MKKIILLLLLISQVLFLSTADEAFVEHSRISYMSSFRILGVIELRAQKDKNSSVTYCTLNHEGGMKVTVLEVLESDTLKGKHGVWLYVLLTAPMWVDNGEWIEKYQKYLIFLPDDMPVFDFE